MRVILLKPHTHAGVQCVPGDEIDVTPAEVGWLERAGVIMPPAAKPQKQPKQSQETAE